MNVPIHSMEKFRQREEADQAIQDEALLRKRFRDRERERERQASLRLIAWAALALLVAAGFMGYLLWPAMVSVLRALESW